MAAVPNPLGVSSLLEVANLAAAGSPEEDPATARERADRQGRERRRVAVDLRVPGPVGLRVPDPARVGLRAAALDPEAARSRVEAAGGWP